jgi:hypothetical protein
MLMACGFLGEDQLKPKQVQPDQLEELTKYFNQRREKARSRIKIVAFDLEDGFSRCKGEFLYDVGMLSQEPVIARRSPF